MGLKASLSQPLARYIARRYARWQHRPETTQRELLAKLTATAAGTVFGRAHDLGGVRTPVDLARQVPVRDYEALKPWFDRTQAGQADVLWPGHPLYLAKTSGTTSGTKYIPITKDSIPNHIDGARDALLHYIYRTGRSR